VYQFIPVFTASKEKSSKALPWNCALGVGEGGRAAGLTAAGEPAREPNLLQKQRTGRP